MPTTSTQHTDSRTLFRLGSRLGGLGRLGLSTLAGLAVTATTLTAVPAAAQPAAAIEETGTASLLTPTEVELATLLHRLEADAERLGLDELESAAGMVRDSLSTRATDRSERLAEASEELDEYLQTAEDAENARERAAALSDALRLAVELELLHTTRSEFDLDPRVKPLVDAAIGAARLAEQSGDWLLSSELYARLQILYEDTGEYRAESDRLGRRLAMIRLYAPERLWELRQARLELEDPEEVDELQPYNPTGDTYQQRLNGISEDIVVRGMQQIAFNHLDRSAMTYTDMLVSGLDAVETMATTTDIAVAFPRLEDDATRDRFIQNIGQLRDRVESRGRATRTDVWTTLLTLINASDQTVRIPKEAILHEFGNGAIAALDDYTAIIWPDEVARFERSIRGQFSGVGIQIEMADDQSIRVVTPIQGSPAQRARVRAGDLIRAVDGQTTLGFTLDQAVDNITGPQGTTVEVTFERPSLEEDGESTTFTAELVREAVKLPVVKGWRKTGPKDEDWDWFIREDSGIGYLRLTGFSEQATADFDDAVERMRSAGLEGLVLDLRFNPGGSLDQAIQLASRFVPRGNLVVKTEAAGGVVLSSTNALRTSESVRLDDIPVAVLINNGSASASEILSGAIQAHAKDTELDAVVIGERSFGKGSVQNVQRLDRFGKSQIKFTTSYYKLHGGRTIHREPGASVWGIDPDIAVEMLPEQTLEAARIRRDADLWPMDENGNLIEDPDSRDPDELITSGVDLQLITALAALERASSDEEPIQVTTIAD